MNRQLVARTWVYSGIRDIFFAFDQDGETFTDNLLFAEIMGLEKIIKAVILFNNHEEYEALSKKEAKNKINEIAKSWGHDFKSIFNELSKIGVDQINHLKTMNFDGYLGNDLVRAIKAGYMETRYPVPIPISDTFPIKGTKYKHDPLWSSGISKFIYAVCAACLEFLASKMAVGELWQQFQKNYQHKESLNRFNNLFWSPSTEKCL